MLLQNADQTLNSQRAQINKLNERIDYLTSEDSTLRFTIAMLAIQAALLIWMAMR